MPEKGEKLSKTLKAAATGAMILALLFNSMPAHATQRIETGKQPETPCAAAPLAKVETGAVFSDPLEGRAGAVSERLCSYFKQAYAGSTIKLAAFVISGESGEDYVDQLLAAHARGVEIQVVIDGWQISKAPAARLINTLGTDMSSGSWVAVCSHQSPEGNTSSCQGTKGMHNKFVLFSALGGQENVVVQASANVTDVNHTSYWNNALTVTGDDGLYDAYRSYHADLARMEQSPDYNKTVASRGPAGASVVRFFPAAADDPVAQRLARLECKNRNSSAAVVMSEWDDTRTAIAEELARLKTQGCAVSVAAGPVGAQVANILDAAGISRRSVEDSSTTGRIHSKYLVVSGLREVASSEGCRGDASFVFTGSHNYNSTSLRRNDEAILELHNRNVVKDYHANAQRLMQIGVPAAG